MKILHFSYFNTVDVPLTFCRVYEAMGHHARLLTLYKHRGDIPEDICLHKKLFDPWWLRVVRSSREKRSEKLIAEKAVIGAMHEYKPGNALEHFSIALRDQLRSIGFARLAKKYDLYGFDLYHFHGGIDYFRDSRWVKKLVAMGKPVLCHYHGPDMRTRGIVKAVDEASKLNLTSEFDLLGLHPRLKYLPIPYDDSHLPQRAASCAKIRIIHTPSNPAAKGTHLIEPVLKRIASERDIEYAVFTGISRKRVIEEKARSHIAIEQIGNFGGTGYGVNSLETLSMKIPTVTEFTPEYEAFLKGHPFVLADQTTLHDVLLRLIDDEAYRNATGLAGRKWVQDHHSYSNVWKTMLDYMEETMPEAAKRLKTETSKE
jgi:hypothetical protein